MSYTAGNLQVDIVSVDNNAIMSINNTAKALSTLSNALNKFNATESVFAMQKLEYIISKIGTATNSINVNNLNSLANVGKSLSAISKIGNLANVDYDKVGQGFNSLTNAIKPFLQEVKGAESALTALYGTLQKFGNSNNGGGSGSIDLDLSKKLNIAYVYGKLRVTVNLVKRLASSVRKILQYGTDYTETLNLWQVAMGNNLSMAEKFVTQMNKAYSISEKTLMNAQATYKNMLSTLGDLSDDMAYTISEAVTKMAVDYASLYNVSIDDAITKFQSALAGQVRPIRSLSGYDITESTLYELYKQIGGTKTIRSLTQTERRLLSIYAIFTQMDESGALGDMEKTIDNVANQTRMISENGEQVATWFGISFQYLLQSSGVLKYINAFLITLSEILKTISYSLGYETPDFANDWADNVEDTEDAVNNLTSKLLDFDKIRSLDATDSNVLGIDEKVLEALSEYNSQIGNSISSANELAQKWLNVLGFIDKNSDGIYEMTNKAKALLEVLKFIAITLGVLLGQAVLTSLSKIIKSITSLTNASQLLSTVLVSGIIYGIIKFIEAINEGDTKTAIIAGTITTVLISALVLFRLYTKKAALATAEFTVGLQNANPTLLLHGAYLGKTATAIKKVGTSLVALVGSYSLVYGIISGLDGTSKKVVSICAIVVGAIMAVVAAIVAMKTAISWGSMLPVLLAGVGAAIAGVQGLTETVVPQYAVGASDIDDGTLFVAGEMGKTEAVYTGSNGKTNVANIQQMQTAFNGALNEWWKSAKSDIPQFKEVSSTGIYEINKSEMKRRGEW